MSEHPVPVVHGELVPTPAPTRSVLDGPLGLPVRMAGSAVRVASRLPVVGRAVDAGVDLAATAAHDAVTLTRDTAVVIAREIVSILTNETDLTGLIESVDLNRLLATVDLNAVLARVDLDAVVAGIDVNALVDRIDLDRALSRVDVDRLIASVDLVGVANEVIDGVDLPEIIRDASGSVTADVMTDVRTSGERADDAVASAIGRLLRRKAAEGAENAGD